MAQKKTRPQGEHGAEVWQYAQDITQGKKIACKELKQATARFLRDIEKGEYDFRPRDADLVIDLIENQIVHLQGETLEGDPLRGTPLFLLPWQKFIIYNLLGFYIKGKKARRFKEAFIFLARKNGKTLFASALAWALAMLEYKSGSSVYIVGASLRQAMQSFTNLKENLTKNIYTSDQKASADGWRIIDNNMGHVIENMNVLGGSLRIEALAANPEAHDSLNSNIQICDELHAYKSPKQYQVIKDSGKAYTNRLCIGITTAGDNKVSFCYRHLENCQKILDGTNKAEHFFVFICKADEPREGELDFLAPEEHEKANPSYGVTIRPLDMIQDAEQAKSDPQRRKEFLAKSLNVYTSSVRSYFDLEQFRASDERYTWTLEELAKLPVDWYGGADLSKLYDLSAAALFGEYKGVDIIITHGFFPSAQATRKAEEDQIPLFGWIEDGNLTATNGATIDYSDVVKWFKDMRDMGFKIREVGFDRKFAREFFAMMKAEGFRMYDEPQLYFHKSQGFKRIEKSALDRKLYYLHSEAYEYCIQNVHARECVDDAIKYEKATPTARIDLFDASVFACMRYINRKQVTQAAMKWLGIEDKEE